MSTITIEQRKLLDGQKYSTGHLFTGVASGTTVRFHVKNPVGSGKILGFVPVKISTSAGARVRRLKNPTIDTDGTPVNIVNENFMHNEDTVGQAFHTPTLVDNGVPFNEQYFGQGTRKIGATGDGETIILGEGNSLVIEIESLSSSNNISIKSSYVEINTE